MAYQQQQQQSTLHTLAPGSCTFIQAHRRTTERGLAGTCNHTAHQSVPVQPTPSSYSTVDAAAKPRLRAEPPQVGLAQHIASEGTSSAVEDGLLKQLGSVDPARAAKQSLFW